MMIKLVLLFVFSVVCLLNNQSAFAIDATLCTPAKIALVKRNANRFNLLCDNFSGRVENVTKRLAAATSDSVQRRLITRQKALKKSQVRYCSKFVLLSEQLKVLTSSCSTIAPTPNPEATPSPSPTPVATSTQSPKPAPTPLGTATPQPSPTPTPTPRPIICSYPAPPIGCYYFQGPTFDPKTQCGLILECGVLRDKV